jgi:hypothetical protein
MVVLVIPHCWEDANTEVYYWYMMLKNFSEKRLWISGVRNAIILLRFLICMQTKH